VQISDVQMKGWLVEAGGQAFTRALRQALGDRPCSIKHVMGNNREERQGVELDLSHIPAYMVSFTTFTIKILYL
jgi:hypothetical protein